MIFPSREIAALTLAMTIAQTALRLWQPPTRCHCEEQQRSDVAIPKIETQTLWLLPMTALVFAITNRASPLHSQYERGKNSNRNSARVLAWWVRLTAGFPRSLRSLGMTRVSGMRLSAILPRLRSQ